MRLLLETIKCWLGPVETRNIALLSAITKRDSRQKCTEMAWRVTGAFVCEWTAQGVHAHIIELVRSFSNCSCIIVFIFELLFLVYFDFYDHISSFYYGIDRNNRSLVRV